MSLDSIQRTVMTQGDERSDNIVGGLDEQVVVDATIEPDVIETVEPVDDIGYMDSLEAEDTVVPTEVFEPVEFNEPMLDHMRNELIINAGDNGMALVDMYEGGEHISVDGSISQEMHDLAKDVGLSDGEINQVRSRFMDDVNQAKVHAEALVGTDVLADTMEFVHANFTDAETKILRQKLTEDADAALVHLVDYVKAEKEK